MPGSAPQSPDAVRYDQRASFSPCSTRRSPRHAPDALAGKLPPPRRCRRRPCRRPARRPASLRAAPFSRRRITSFRGRTRLCTLSRNATASKICAAPRLHARSRTRFPGTRAPAYHALRRGPRAGRSAPSIFGAPRFGRYVATRFLADADLHGHRPAVRTAAAPSLSVPRSATYPPRRFIPPRSPCLPRAAHWRAPDPRGAARRPRRRVRSLLAAAAHPLYRSVLHARRCPARHFGGNQLPDSSFGLSPLCPCPAIELNIRTAQALRQYFPRLRPAQA